MKILFVQNNIFSENASGVPRVTYNLGKYFSQQGLEVAYFSFQTDNHGEVEYGKLYHAEATNGIENHENINKLKACIANFKPDWIVNQNPYEGKIRHVIKDAKTKHNFKSIGCIHNSLFPFKNNVKSIMKRTLPKPLNHVMATDSMSKIPLFYHKKKQRLELGEIVNIHDYTFLYTPANLEEMKYFVKPENINPDKIKFMVNPVLNVQEEVPKKKKVILHLGRLNVPQKRSDLLLDFWENAYKLIPEWTFKVVGDGPYFEALKKDLEQRQLPRIQLLGFQKAEPYYEEAALFMMPSAYEGLPHTIIDSQSYACPTLAFNSYNALEYIVKDKENAILAKPYNVKQMANLCIEVISNDDTLKQMQKKALINAKRYSIDSVGSAWLNILNS